MTAICASSFSLEQFSLEQFMVGGGTDQPQASTSALEQQPQPQHNNNNTTHNSRAVTKTTNDHHNNLASARHLANILGNEQKEFVYALVEPRVIADDRLLMNLLNAEEVLMPIKYCEHMQTECTPVMRYRVVDWMHDVCQEERCECEVLPLAVNLLDRFLSREVIFKTQLQVLATTCLFIAAKVKLSQPFSGDKLCKYTDDCMTIHDLMSWELLVLKTLNWDVSTPGVFDFIEHLLSRFPLSSDVANLIRAECQSLVPAVCRDYRLCSFAMSMQACMCLYASAARINVAGLAIDMLAYIHQWLRYDPELLQAVADDTLLVSVDHTNKMLCATPKHTNNTTIANNNTKAQYHGNNNNSKQATQWNEMLGGPSASEQLLCTPPSVDNHSMHHRHDTVVTPTDVQDVFAMIR